MRRVAMRCEIQSQNRTSCDVMRGTRSKYNKSDEVVRLSTKSMNKIWWVEALLLLKLEYVQGFYTKYFD
jgi:hypothetical protein